MDPIWIVEAKFTVAVDPDVEPFRDESGLPFEGFQSLWQPPSHPNSITFALKPMVLGINDFKKPPIMEVIEKPLERGFNTP